MPTQTAESVHRFKWAAKIAIINRLITNGLTWPLLKFPSDNGRSSKKTSQHDVRGIRLCSPIFSHQKTAPKKIATFNNRQRTAPIHPGNHEKGAKHAAINGLYTKPREVEYNACDSIHLRRASTSVTNTSWCGYNKAV